MRAATADASAVCGWKFVFKSYIPVKIFKRLLGKNQNHCYTIVYAKFFKPHKAVTAVAVFSGKDVKERRHFNPVEKNASTQSFTSKSDESGKGFDEQISTAEEILSLKEKVLDRNVTKLWGTFLSGTFLSKIGIFRQRFQRSGRLKSVLITRDIGQVFQLTHPISTVWFLVFNRRVHFHLFAL